MKYIKLLAIALGALIMSACSDSKDYNTAADVTVEMEKSEITIKEHVGRFTVPVKVTGNPNGTVRVKIKLEPSGNNPANPFEETNGNWAGNYILTSDEIYIPSDDKVANIEIFAVDDRVINDDRSFIVTIESAEGATIGSAKSTLIVLLDNDKIPYERIQGEWLMTYLDPNNSEQKVTVMLNGYDEESKKYGVELKLDNLFAGNATEEGTSAQVYFFEDEANDMRYIELIIPQVIGVYASDPNYMIWLITLQRDLGGNFGLGLNEIYLTGMISDDFETIEFDQDLGFYGYLASASFDAQGGGLGGGINIVMQRK